jgi:hypothetical protein
MTDDKEEYFANLDPWSLAVDNASTIPRGVDTEVLLDLGYSPLDTDRLARIMKKHRDKQLASNPPPSLAKGPGRALGRPTGSGRLSGRAAMLVDVGTERAKRRPNNFRNFTFDPPLPPEDANGQFRLF